VWVHAQAFVGRRTRRRTGARIRAARAGETAVGARDSGTIIEAMPLAHVVYLFVFIAWIYATAGCWLLQVTCYPTYGLVGRAEFVPFHVEFGRRLIPVFVVPAILANLGSLALFVMRPPTVPLIDVIVAAVCSGVILGTTALIEVPKHVALDREGKSDKILSELVGSNVPRVIGWTVGAIALTHGLTHAFKAA
jgi:hypothetical protein